MIFNIITPSYNQARFLAETIESVICQEGDFFIDYIIVDGQSTDNSVEIIKNFASLLKEKVWNIKCRGINLRWFSEKDRGQTDALMKGFALATGDVLAWLNSDDTYMPGALQRVSAEFAAQPGLSVVYGKSHYTDSVGTIVGQYPTGPFDYKGLATFNFICQPSTFFKRSSFEAAGLLDADLQFAMDYDLWIRLAKSFEFFYLQEFIATYRLHEESKTVAEKGALANHEEALMVAIKYYSWAPLSRVYVSCHQWISDNFPSLLKKLVFPVVVSALSYSLIRYLYLNKGVRLDDFRSLGSTKIGDFRRARLGLYRKP